MHVMLPGPVEQGPKMLSAFARGWVITSVTAYWNDLGHLEKRATASSYARWRKGQARRGQPNPYIGGPRWTATCRVALGTASIVRHAARV